MKKTSLFLFLCVFMAACHNDAPVQDNYYYDDYEYVPYVSEIKTIETNGPSDLTVETAHHVVQVVGDPAKQYKYYVWRGDTDMATADPDVIVDRGAVMVRQED